MTYYPGPIPVELTSTPTIGALQYEADDYVGPSTTPASIANAVLGAGRSIILESATLLDRSGNAATLDLLVFNATFTAPADEAAWSISDADMAKCRGIYRFSDWKASALNCVSHIPILGTRIILPATTLYYAFVTRELKTWAVGDLTLVLVGSQE